MPAARFKMRLNQLSRILRVSTRRIKFCWVGTGGAGGTTEPEEPATGGVTAEGAAGDGVAGAEVTTGAGAAGVGVGAGAAGGADGPVAGIKDLSQPLTELTGKVKGAKPKKVAREL